MTTTDTIILVGGIAVGCTGTFFAFRAAGRAQTRAGAEGMAILGSVYLLLGVLGPLGLWFYSWLQTK
jgi:hypothetical protein